MQTVKIMLDLFNGPIWGDYFIDDKFTSGTGIPLIDNDVELQKINDEIYDMFESYYEFDSHDVACWYNEEQEKADKPKMLALLKKLNDRLDEINDGSFVVEDLETPRVQAL